MIVSRLRWFLGRLISPARSLVPGGFASAEVPLDAEPPADGASATDDDVEGDERPQ